MDPVLHSFAYAVDYLADQLADVPDTDLAAQPAGVVNHPAWTLGHLALVCQNLGGVVGVAPWLPEDGAGRVGPGSTPVADRRAYPSKADALAALRDARARIADAVGRLDAAALDAPFPDPSYLDVFHTVRHFLIQVLVGHTAYHVGQVGVWHRAMGLPPMARSFE